YRSNQNNRAIRFRPQNPQQSPSIQARKHVMLSVLAKHLQKDIAQMEILRGIPLRMTHARPRSARPAKHIVHFSRFLIWRPRMQRPVMNPSFLDELAPAVPKRRWSLLRIVGRL